MGHLNQFPILTRSNELEVQVLEAPVNEREALAIIQEMTQPSALYEPDFVPTSDPEKELVLSELKKLASYPQSEVYSGYAKYALAWRHVRLATLAHSEGKRAEVDSNLAAANEFLSDLDETVLAIGDRVDLLRSELRELQVKLRPTE